MSKNLLFIFLIALSAACSTTRPFKGSDGKKIPNSIAQTRRVPINGSRQFITIRGTDQRNPVLLWLHGGPGNLSMPLYMHYNADLERRFTVVYWDQRGSGKSYSKRIAPQSMTLEQFVEDTHVLTSWLKKRFNQEKIVLVGHSWGGLLGMHVIAKYPADYHAFVAVSPVTNGPESERLSYEFVLNNAQQKKDTSALSTLKKIGIPVNGLYKGGISSIKQQRDLVKKYGGVFHQNLQATSSRIFAQSKEYGILNYLKMNKIQRMSFPMIGKIWPSMDLKRQIPAVSVPVYFCLGRYDYNCPSSLVADYYDFLRAPAKELIWFEESGHGACWEEPQKFHAILTDKVFPITQGLTKGK